MIYINIRDDDTNYFTSPEDLRAAYGDLWGEITISIAAIPFVHGSHEITRKMPVYNIRRNMFRDLRKYELKMNSSQLAAYHKLYPLGNNKKLVDFLKFYINNQKIEILLHGYSHRYYEDGPEFINCHMNFYQIRDGMEYLSKLFNQNIRYFVPPSNSIDVMNLTYLNQLRLSLMTSGGLTSYNKFEKFKVFLQKILDNPHIISERNKHIENIFYQYNDVNVINSYTFGLSDSFQDYFDRYRRTIEKYGYICIATHYLALKEKLLYKEEFNKLIDHIIKRYKSADFISANNLLKMIIDK